MVNVEHNLPILVSLDTLGADCAIGNPAEPSDLRIARIDAGHLSRFQRMVAEQEYSIDLGLLTFRYAEVTLCGTCNLPYPDRARNVCMRCIAISNGDLLLLHDFNVATF